MKTRREALIGTLALAASPALGGTPSALARSGEIVICENGHPIYEAESGIYARQVIGKSVQYPWSPVGGFMIDGDEPCHHCGAGWWRHQDGKIALRFADGWRCEQIGVDPDLLRAGEQKLLGSGSYRNLATGMCASGSKA